MLSFNDAQAVCKHGLSTDAHRVVLTYYAISVKDGQAYMVSTDTHRLCVAKIAEPFGVAEGETKVLNGDSTAKYPDFARVIPSQSTRSMIVDADTFLLALKCLQPVYRKCSNRVILRVNAELKRLTLEVRSYEGILPSIAIGLEEVDFPKSKPKTKNTEPLEIAFNGNYLIGAAKAISMIGPTGVPHYIRFEMTEPSRPITMALQDSDWYTEVLMPMARP